MTNRTECRCVSLGKVKAEVHMSEVGCEQRDKFKGKTRVTFAGKRKKVTRTVTTKLLNIMVASHCLTGGWEVRSGLICPQRKSEVNVKN